jgi:hypothetical protein
MPAHTKTTVALSDGGGMIKICAKKVNCTISQTSVIVIQLCLVGSLVVLRTTIQQGTVEYVS